MHHTYDVDSCRWTHAVRTFDKATDLRHTPFIVTHWLSLVFDQETQNPAKPCNSIDELAPTLAGSSRSKIAHAKFDQANSWPWPVSRRGRLGAGLCRTECCGCKQVLASCKRRSSTDRHFWLLLATVSETRVWARDQVDLQWFRLACGAAELVVAVPCIRRTAASAELISAVEVSTESRGRSRPSSYWRWRNVLSKLSGEGWRKSLPSWF